MDEKLKISTNRVAGNKARNPIRNLEGMARTSPYDFHLLHIEIGFAPLLC